MHPQFFFFHLNLQRPFSFLQLLMFRNQFPPDNNSCPTVLFDAKARTTVRVTSTVSAFYSQRVHKFPGYFGLFALLSLHFDSHSVMFKEQPTSAFPLKSPSYLIYKHAHTLLFSALLNVSPNKHSVGTSVQQKT